MNNNNFDDIKFNILEVAEKCGIEYDSKPNRRGTFLAKCPFCESSKMKLSLAVELPNGKKNVYRCAKCGSHGSSISLYAKIKGISNKKAREELLNNSFRENKYIKKIIKNSLQLPNCLETTNIDKIDRVYNALLNNLTLSESSYINLKNRGLSDEFIFLKGYKSIPENYEDNIKICKKLISNGYDLSGVPGFYKNKFNCWTFNSIQGYFIPIRNLEGKICSMQIRMNEKFNGLRYIYFTSSKYATGSKALALPNVSYGSNGINDIYITEGPLKGDIASYLSNDTFISVPGVNSGLNILIEYLLKLKPNRVIIAYDMDMFEVVEVKHALINLHSLLKKNKIYSEIKFWDKHFKGIDDYYIAQNYGHK